MLMVPFFSGFKPKGQIAAASDVVGKGKEKSALVSICTLKHTCLGWREWLWVQGQA